MNAESVFKLKPGERPALFWSFCYFFLLLCSYYLIRPIRSEMVVISGIRDLHWLVTLVFVVMLIIVPLFAWLTRVLPRKQFLLVVYTVFSIQLILFAWWFKGNDVTPWMARGVYVWGGVYSLFVVSVFWSFMADIFDRDQSRRLFATIAAGGTFGALCGPLITASLVTRFGKAPSFLLAAFALLISLVCIDRLFRWKNQQSEAREEPLSEQRAGENEEFSEDLWSGVKRILKSPYLLGICGLMLGYSLCSTLLSILVAEQVELLYTDSNERTRLFSLIDSAVNALTLCFQLFITAPLLKWLGMSRMLMVLPLTLLLGGAMAWVHPAFLLLGTIEVLRRAFEYGINKPAREMLYVPLPRDEKYRAKNFIDTTVHRGGDMASTWAMGGLRALEISTQGVLLVVVAAAGLWSALAWSTGRRYRAMNERRSSGSASREEARPT